MKEHNSRMHDRSKKGSSTALYEMEIGTEMKKRELHNCTALQTSAVQNYSRKETKQRELTPSPA
jgi:hypothetical protein